MGAMSHFRDIVFWNLCVVVVSFLMIGLYGSAFAPCWTANAMIFALGKSCFNNCLISQSNRFINLLLCKLKMFSKCPAVVHPNLICLWAVSL